MLDWNQITSFLTVAVILTLMPGPDILFVAAQSMTKSRLGGIAVALGLCTGLLVHTTAAALGVSAVVLSSEGALFAVKALGAAYLLYLAWKTWSGRHAGATPASETAPAAKSFRFGALYRRGITMNVINPKVSLFFLALLPQFVSEQSGSIPLQMLQLGLLFIAQALVIFTCVSLLSGFAGGIVTGRSPKWAPRLAVVEAVIYVLLTVNLFLL
ncbi:LysE family translocator [Paenibacillus thailandensis]|uniref:LysE family translocator n=1 Tax=Paenibacillus thailandensis TaxID=393250 RepID=A0ABW5R184_9BACL